MASGRLMTTLPFTRAVVLTMRSFAPRKLPLLAILLACPRVSATSQRILWSSISSILSELTGLEQSLFRTMPHLTVCSHALQVMTSKYSTQQETRERFCDSSSVRSPGTKTLTRIHFSSSLCVWRGGEGRGGEGRGGKGRGGEGRGGEGRGGEERRGEERRGEERGRRGGRRGEKGEEEREGKERGRASEISLKYYTVSLQRLFLFTSRCHGW